MSSQRKNWETKKLTEVAEYLPTGVPQYTGEKEYYSTGSIKATGNQPEGLFSFDKRPARANRLSKTGDVFQARMKATDKALLIDDSLNDKLFSSGFIQLRPIERQYDKRLLYYFLKSKLFLNQRDEYATGSTQEALTDRYAQEILIPFPPLPEQRRLAKSLERLLEKCRSTQERLNKIPETLKRLRLSILAAACAGNLTKDFEGQSLKTTERYYSELLQSRTQNAYRKSSSQKEPFEPAEIDSYEVPTHWLKVSLDSITTKIVDGVHKKPNYTPAGIPFIKVNNLTSGPGIDFGKTSYISPSDHQEFIKRANPSKGDILITKDGTLGVTKAIKTDTEFSIFVSVALVKPVDYGMTDFLEIVLSSPQVQKTMKATGTGLQHIHLRDLKASCIPFPHISEQKEIVRRVKSLFKIITSIEDKFEIAQRQNNDLTQSILGKAFRGELL